MKKIFIFLIIAIAALPVHAGTVSEKDSDEDGISDYNEASVYHTSPEMKDTDNDGYDDFNEIKNGYPPLNKDKVKLNKIDSDSDGLSDEMEIKFHTDPLRTDTDGDGHTDGDEIKNAYDPLKNGDYKLKKLIKIETGKQKLSYYLGVVELGKYPVSTGKPGMPTPKGDFTIANKSKRPWSAAYGLWMPYWMGIRGTRVGIHELPEWPDGYKEGADHLGKPVSHGCIRLGVGPAKILYDWAEIGTSVVIY